MMYNEGVNKEYCSVKRGAVNEKVNITYAFRFAFVLL